MHKTLVIVEALLVVILLLVGACTPTPEKNYLSALEGLAVTTTRYHPEVVPPPLGSKYPPTFYEPILIGRVPPSITGSLTLMPYAQQADYDAVELQWFREGQTLDILFEANKPVLWQLDKPNTVDVDAILGVSEVSAGELGLLDVWGFFYEGHITEVQRPDGTIQRSKYSTALRVIAWADGFPKLRFSNFSSEVVEISYSIWKGGFVPNFINDYTEAWEKYWDSSGVTEEEILKMKRDMEKYLMEKWQ